MLYYSMFDFLRVPQPGLRGARRRPPIPPPGAATARRGSPCGGAAESGAGGPGADRPGQSRAPRLRGRRRRRGMTPEPGGRERGHASRLCAALGARRAPRIGPELPGRHGASCTVPFHAQREREKERERDRGENRERERAWGRLCMPSLNRCWHDVNIIDR